MLITIPERPFPDPETQAILFSKFHVSSLSLSNRSIE